MPPIRQSVNGFLNETAQIIPVDRQFKPNLLQLQSSLLQPVLSFRAAPLADQLLGVEVFALTTTLVGAQTKIVWSSLPVPSEEVHRYVGLWVSHNTTALIQFALTTRTQRGQTGAIFASGRDARKGMGAGIRVNMLIASPDNSISALDWQSAPYDLYPGMSFQLESIDSLALLDTVTFQGYRLRMRGPVAVGGVDVTADITPTAS